MTRFKYVVDNLGGNTVGHLLKSYLMPDTYSSIATAYFTVSGFNLIADELETSKGFRLLIGSEPGAKPLDAMVMDIWKNIDIRDSSKHAERAVDFFQRLNVQIRLHPGPFFHGKTYILNHPEPIFSPTNEDYIEIAADALKDKYSLEELQSGRHRPLQFIYSGVPISQTQGVNAIVGSSNFTYGGLRKNTELNLFDPRGESIVELLTWFEERWNASGDFKDGFIKALKGYYKPFDPFWIYVKALFELYKDELGLETEDTTVSKIELADFQRAGYRAASKILEQWGGVLIADAPGLGKTYIAGKILEDYAYSKREAALIVCPAEVEQIWEKFIKNNNIPKYEIVHTEMLGRGMHDGRPAVDPADYTNCPFILVDECHHFRNPDAGRYHWFQELLAMPKPQVKIGGKVRQLERKIVFITATPVNNSVWDLYWQLKLLYGEKIEDIAFRLGIMELDKYFSASESGKGNLYELMERVAVRRSRVFIKECYPNAQLDGKPIKFPEQRIDNIPYKLHHQLGNLYDDAAAIIDSLKLAPYCLESYKKVGKDPTIVKRSEILSMLFRVLLLKRLESSLWAFRKSVSKLLHLFESSRDMVDKGKVFEPEHLREYVELTESAEEDGTDAEVEEFEKVAMSPEDFEIDDFKKHLEKDIDALYSILTTIPESEDTMMDIDNKCKAVLEKISSNQGKKLIFTSFMDTASYLFNRLLTQKKRVGFVTGDECKLWTGTTVENSKRSEIIRLFSPTSNDFKVKKEDEINILIATDVFSEAINLQDANTVLNYDLPWNPMKLVQRAGRINRMGSNHPEVYILNVFPEKGLESILKIMKKLQEKIAQTHRSVGLEWSLLGEQPLTVDFASTIERMRKKDSKVLIDIEKNMENLVGSDPLEQLLAILQHLSIEDIKKIPDGAGSLTSIIAPSGIHKAGFFVAYRRKRSKSDVDRIWRFYPEQGGALKNKTEMVPLINFPDSYPSLDRFGEDSLNNLRRYRETIEREIHQVDMRQRTPHYAGHVRKAFELVQRQGRGDIYKFLISTGKKGAIERAIRKIHFKDEQKAIKQLEELMKRFGHLTEQTEQLQDIQEKIKDECEEPTIPYIGEIEQIPPERDTQLELVCWIHILSATEGDKQPLENEKWSPNVKGQKAFKETKLNGQSKLV